MEVLEFDLVAKSLPDLSAILNVSAGQTGLHLHADTMYSIADWTYDKRESAQTWEDIVDALRRQRIIVIRFADAPGFTNAGLYIEKKNADYVYSFWCNLPDDFPLNPTVGSIVQWFREAGRMERIIRMIQSLWIDYTAFAIGVESSFVYAEDVCDMMRKSHGAFFWLLYEPLVRYDRARIKPIDALSQPHAYAYCTLQSDAAEDGRKIHFFEDNYCQIELLPEADTDWAKRAVDRKKRTSIPERPFVIQQLGIKQERFSKVMLKVFDQFQVFWGETEDHLCKSTYAFGMSDRVTVFSEVENGVVSALWLTLDIKEAGDREQAEKMLHVISEIAPLVLVDWGWSCAILLKDTDALSAYLDKRFKAFLGELTDASDIQQD